MQKSSDFSQSKSFFEYYGVEEKIIQDEEKELWPVIWQDHNC